VPGKRASPHNLRRFRANNYHQRRVESLDLRGTAKVRPQSPVLFLVPKILARTREPPFWQKALLRYSRDTSPFISRQDTPGIVMETPVEYVGRTDCKPDNE